MDSLKVFAVVMVSLLIVRLVSAFVTARLMVEFFGLLFVPALVGVTLTFMVAGA